MNSLFPLHNNSRDDVLAWVKQQAAMLTNQEKLYNNDILVKYSQLKQLSLHKQSMFNGGYLFLQDIYFKRFIYDL